MKRRNVLRSLAVVAVIGITLFGGSLAVRWFDGGTLGKRLSFSPRIEVRGLAHIKAASTNWDGVRGVATFLKNVVKGVDSIIVSLTSSGALNLTSSVVFSNGTYRMKFNPGFATAVTSQAFGSKTYQYSFEVWRESDSTKIMEIFFDDPSNKSEALVIWSPQAFDSDMNQAGTAKMECAVTGGTADGKMICSWNNGPFYSGSSGWSRNGRIKADVDSTNSVMNVKAIASLKVGLDPCGSAPADYYALAFVANTAAPNQTMAIWGLNNDSVAATACGAANSTNYGCFNTSANASASDSSKYFVTDGVTDCGTGYPTKSSVDTVFADTSDGMDKATVAALNVAFQQSATMPDVTN